MTEQVQNGPPPEALYWPFTSTDAMELCGIVEIMCMEGWILAGGMICGHVQTAPCFIQTMISPLGIIRQKMNLGIPVL